MKKYFSLVLLAVTGVVLMASCGDAKKEKKMVDGGAKTTQINAADSTTWTDVQWIDSTFDFGELEAGPIVAASFRFKNTGNKPLVIESVQASCGCTEPEKPEQAVMPGDEGVVKAKFKSEHQSGDIQKTVTVVANTVNRTYYLIIKGKVNPKKQS